MRSLRRWFEGTVFIGPSLIALGVVAVYPIVYAVYSSLHSWHLHRPALRSFAGADNFVQLFGDSRFLNSLQATATFTVTSVAITMVLGFLLALLIEAPFPAKNLVRALLTIPMIMTPVVSALVWRVLLLEPDVGLINWLLRGLGITGPAWIASSPAALITVIAVNAWFMTPFVLLIVDAALAGIPREVVEAAEIDGANYWQRVWHILVPMMRGTLAFTVIFRITTDFRMFDIVFVMTGGGPAFDTQLLSIWVYSTALRSFQVGYANAGAVVMMVAIALTCFLIWRFFATGRGGER